MNKTFNQNIRLMSLNMVIKLPIIKETQELNSADTIHGESIYVIQ
jgi:hypothetical protein